MTYEAQVSVITAMMIQLNQKTDPTDVYGATTSARTFCTLSPDSAIEGIYGLRPAG